MPPRAGSPEFVAHPGHALLGSTGVPGDKSISHRALMLGAVAEGDTVIRGFLEGEDTLATLSAFRQMGIAIERPAPGEVIVHGAGLRGLHVPPAPLDLGNSGTSARLLCGLLAGQEFSSTLTGDPSLSRRPMRRVIDPLARMGAQITCTAGGTLPATIYGGSPLTGTAHELPVASAQLKSALLLAGLYASGETCVREPAPTRDHTERMLRYFGGRLRRDGDRICISPGALKGMPVDVPGDISSAAFLVVAACIVPGSELHLRGVGVNPTRAAVISILRDMGADIQVRHRDGADVEPVADLTVRCTGLRGTRIAPELVSNAIDEFPAILVAAAFADGATVLTGAGELRVKESDRIAALAEGLLQLGVRCKAVTDGMTVVGGKPAGGTIDSHGDHRIAMAFAVAGLAAAGPVVVRDCANVRTSFPDFVPVLRAVGADITVREAEHD